MKRTLFAFLITATCTGLIFSACKKSNDSKTTDSGTVTNAQMATQADDETMVSSQMDDAANDVITATESNASTSGNSLVLRPLICDGSVEFNTETDPMTMTITYSSEGSCTLARTRSGVIVASMAQGSQWKDQNAKITVTFHDYTVTRTADQKSVTLNGSYTITNTSGKLLVNLASSGTIIHTITSSNMSIKFSEDNTLRTWNVARQHTFTYDNGANLAVTGLHTEGDISNISEWGMNRYGAAFTTAIDTPLVIRQSCDYRVTSGKVTHTTALYTASATFGLNQAGTATSCPAEGLTYFYHLVCTVKGGAEFSIVLPY